MQWYLSSIYPSINSIIADRANKQPASARWLRVRLPWNFHGIATPCQAFPTGDWRRDAHTGGGPLTYRSWGVNEKFNVLVASQQCGSRRQAAQKRATRANWNGRAALKMRQTQLWGRPGSLSGSPPSVAPLFACTAVTTSSAPSFDISVATGFFRLLHNEQKKHPIVFIIRGKSRSFLDRYFRSLPSCWGVAKFGRV